ncbi:MAG: hypothetical protein ABIC04_04730 [Nanoarchaeota archaeon]
MVAYNTVNKFRHLENTLDNLAEVTNAFMAAYTVLMPSGRYVDTVNLANYTMRLLPWINLETELHNALGAIIYEDLLRTVNHATEDELVAIIDDCEIFSSIKQKAKKFGYLDDRLECVAYSAINGYINAIRGDVPRENYGFDPSRGQAELLLVAKSIFQKYVNPDTPQGKQLGNLLDSISL